MCIKNFIQSRTMAHILKFMCMFLSCLLLRSSSTIQILCMLITQRAINLLFKVDLCTHMISILKLNFHRISLQHSPQKMFELCFRMGLENLSKVYLFCCRVTLSSTSVNGRCKIIISISNLIRSV